jgi:hypothetical protein
MRRIFFDEKLGETQRNSEGCKPHGQGWERWGASRTGKDGSGGRDGSGGSGENKKSEPFWGLTLYSNNEKRLNFF